MRVIYCFKHLSHPYKKVHFKHNYFSFFICPLDLKLGIMIPDTERYNLKTLSVSLGILTQNLHDLRNNDS